MAELRCAQEELLDPLGSASDFCASACRDIGHPDDSAATFEGLAIAAINDLSRAELVAIMEDHEPAAEPGSRTSIAEQMQLSRAFADPELAIRSIEDKVASAVDDFPKVAADIEQGSNPGDLLDPFIVSAMQDLVYGRSATEALEAIALHKILNGDRGPDRTLPRGRDRPMRGNVRALWGRSRLAASKGDGRDFLEALLADVTTAERPEDQSSLSYRARRTQSLRPSTKISNCEDLGLRGLPLPAKVLASRMPTES